MCAAYASLLGNLVSANAIFLLPSLQNLVKNLTVISDYSNDAADSSPKPEISSDGRTSPDAISVSDNVGRIHRAIFGVISLAPSGQAELFSLLAQRFPYKLSAKNAQCDYVTQLLRICEYLPVLQGRILELIVMKCIEIDVEIIVEDSGEVLL